MTLAICCDYPVKKKLDVNNLMNSYKLCYLHCFNTIYTYRANIVAEV